MYVITEKDYELLNKIKNHVEKNYPNEYKLNINFNRITIANSTHILKVRINNNFATVALILKYGILSLYLFKKNHRKIDLLNNSLEIFLVKLNIKYSFIHSFRFF